MKRMISLACALLLVPTLALAQPRTPDEWYKEGETQYNLGNFDDAVKAFKQGFALETVETKKSAYLYNIAQTYRQMKDCTNAQFFYKRFLALREADASKPLKAETRRDVEDRIRDLEECAKQQEAIRNRPPNPQSLKPDGGPTTQTTSITPTGTTQPAKPDGTVVADSTGAATGGEDADDDDGEDDGITATTPGTAPRVLSARLIAGGAKLSTGEYKTGIRPTVALLGGYPIAVNEQLTLEVGAGFTFTPVPYEVMGMSKTGRMVAAVANAGLTYHVAPTVGLRGDLGVGGLFFSGISQSPFTDGLETSGALTMFHVRFGVSVDYAFTPNLVATLAPFAFSFSPAKSGLREDITSITAIDFMIGLGYRM